ncbi:DUF4199 domain-containing protein [Hyunsoonleella sp. SJ7]|uniref:DUF4199 domain-containing protein n=1 Tax=Hyunsoonleella aquatilis TaxID=2762758 RepID=A0A923HF28_9FLAO|nr:DUF4199 domain-containing protein [Hyunsoonleella aquatilis]MBC3758235.1 DUF4199 domain-containing protein [Hyunsoonleella aquatilis]
MKNLILPIRFGLVTSAVLIAYFLVLALFNKHINPAFSLVNAAITLFGIYEAIRLSKLENPGAFSYGEGFKIGVVTGSIATLVFTFFFLFYATEISPSFLPALLDNIHWGFKSNIGMIVFVVAIMGLSTSVVASLTVMQLFKRSNNLA